MHTRHALHVYPSLVPGQYVQLVQRVEHIGVHGHPKPGLAPERSRPAAYPAAQLGAVQDGRRRSSESRDLGRDLTHDLARERNLGRGLARDLARGQFFFLLAVALLARE